MHHLPWQEHPTNVRRTLKKRRKRTKWMSRKGTRKRTSAVLIPLIPPMIHLQLSRCRGNLIEFRRAATCEKQGGSYIVTSSIVCNFDQVWIFFAVCILPTNGPLSLFLGKLHESFVSSVAVATVGLAASFNCAAAASVFLLLWWMLATDSFGWCFYHFFWRSFYGIVPLTP